MDRHISSLQKGILGINSRQKVNFTTPDRIYKMSLGKLFGILGEEAKNVLTSVRSLTCC